MRLQIAYCLHIEAKFKAGYFYRMINNDNEKTVKDFDLIKEIRSAEIDLLKTALIRANGDSNEVAKTLRVDVEFIYTKAKELELEDYIQANKK